ncbi:hypothetical protein TNCV_2387871 [Trichonephila clavipes]|nr:hypothetical protein TNCV_2387871 [Trichonephila clavipes]
MNRYYSTSFAAERNSNKEFIAEITFEYGRMNKLILQFCIVVLRGIWFWDGQDQAPKTHNAVILRPVSANAPASNGNPVTRVHSWLTGTRWHRWQYGVGCIFMGHIRTLHPYKTIPDVCALSEHHCIPSSSFRRTVLAAGDNILSQNDTPCHEDRITKE